MNIELLPDTVRAAEEAAAINNVDNPTPRAWSVEHIVYVAVSNYLDELRQRRQRGLERKAQDAAGQSESREGVARGA